MSALRYAIIDCMLILFVVEGLLSFVNTIGAFKNFHSRITVRQLQASEGNQLLNLRSIGSLAILLIGLSGSPVQAQVDYYNVTNRDQLHNHHFTY